jgi:hypothetical protein
VTAAELRKLRDKRVELHERMDRIEEQLSAPDVQAALKPTREKRERKEAADA